MTDQTTELSESEELAAATPDAPVSDQESARLARLEQEGDIAADYLEGLLDIADLDGDIDMDVEGDRAIVSIDGGEDLTKLVGRRGEVLDALQELTRLAVHQKTGERSRLMLDVANWRGRRREELTALGVQPDVLVCRCEHPLPEGDGGLQVGRPADARDARRLPPPGSPPRLPRSNPRSTPAPARVRPKSGANNTSRCRAGAA